MFLEIALFLILGILTGIFTGLTPSIHINLISVLMIAASKLLLLKFSVLSLAVFIISMSVTHTFIDSIPSIFLGVPDSDTALGILPGHRFLLKGLGLHAVKLTVIGSLGALLLSIFLFPLLILIVKFIYPYLKKLIPFVLILIVLYMILTDRKKCWALFVFLVAGSLGIVIFSIPNLSNPLFPLLSGMFGFSTLLISLNENENIPKQTHKEKKLESKFKSFKAIVAGQFAGFITAVMPGLGGSAAAVLGMQIAGKLGDEGFMVLMGSINTVNFILSMVTLHVLDKARNGSIIAVQKLIGNININYIIIFLIVALIAGALATFLAIKISKIFCRVLVKISYKKVILTILLLITILVITLTGFLGLIILTISTALGLIPAIVKVKRTHAMGCLLLPVILYFLL